MASLNPSKIFPLGRFGGANILVATFGWGKSTNGGGKSTNGGGKFTLPYGFGGERPPALRRRVRTSPCTLFRKKIHKNMPAT
eukprot:3070447-Pyramimonas_sp.AAC.1